MNGTIGAAQGAVTFKTGNTASMEEIDLDELCANRAEFDTAVQASEAIDHYCSSAAWVLPAQRAFSPDAPVLALRSDAGYAALAAGEAPSIGRYYAALESMWGLACPIVGPDPRALALAFFDAMHRRRGDWDALWIGGLSRDALLFKALVSLFASTHSLRWGPTSGRYAALLEGGYSAWLARRPSKFRANIRRTRRRVAERGVTFHPLATEGLGADAIYARILAIEARSWKGLSESGITTGGMRTFYEEALRILVPDRRFRGLVAVLDGEDIGFVFGGILGTTFRGLQCSFDNRFRDLSLGNVLHAMMIESLCEEPITHYDLGSEIAYKARWGEPGLNTVTLVAVQQC
ncbi:MAG: hypothetical protein ACI9MR_001836 [Myxococcota bacterium]|jgi:hypothetical protein